MEGMGCVYDAKRFGLGRNSEITAQSEEIKV